MSFLQYVWEKKVKNLLPLGLLGTLTYLFYKSSLHSPFQFDDLANITKNFSIREFDITKHIFHQTRWFGEMVNKLTFKWAEFDPYLYRVSNLAIHILAGCTLFLLVKTIAEKQSYSQSVKSNYLWLASITSGLFLLHPVQTQTISYVIQARLEGITTLLVLSAALFFTWAFIDDRCKEKYHIDDTISIVIPKASMNLKKGLLFTASLTFSVLACATKEIGVITPFLAVMIDLFFISKFNFQSFKERLFYHMAFAALSWGSVVWYLGANFVYKAFGMQMSVISNRGNVITENPQDYVSAYTFFLTELQSIMHYIKIFFWPVNLCVEYTQKLTTSFWTAEAILPITALAGILGATVSGIWNKQYRMFSFGSLWFFLSLLPRASIIPSAELTCDYKTYIASPGIFLIIALLVLAFTNKFSQEVIKATWGPGKRTKYWDEYGLTFSPVDKKLRFKKDKETVLTVSESSINYTKNFMVFFMVAYAMGKMSETRNLVWENPVDFWTDIVEKNPNKARAHNNLGVALTEKGAEILNQKSMLLREANDMNFQDQQFIAKLEKYQNDADQKFDQAIDLYQKAINLDQLYPDPHSNLAVAYSVRNKENEAIKSLEHAIEMIPDYVEAHNNLAALLIKKKELDSAQELLEKAIELRPFYGKAYFNLGRLYLEKEEKEKAWQAFKSATEGDLDSLDGYQVLAQVSMMTEKYPEAASAYEKCLEKLSYHNNKDLVDNTEFALANAYFLAGDKENAESIYLDLMDKNPGDIKYKYNYAESLFCQSKYSQAKEFFSLILDETDQYPQAVVRVAHCAEKMNDYTAAIKILEDSQGMFDNEESLKIIQNEVGRLRLQDKINNGDGTITGQDLQDAFNV